MRIQNLDPKLGTFKVNLDTLEDLWSLSRFLREGDKVRALTARRQEQLADMGRDREQERVNMVLTVQLEEVAFDEHGHRLRVHGTITEGPEGVGSHHTLYLEAHDHATITRPGGLDRFDRNRLKELEEESGTPTLLVVAMDRDEATVAAILPWGVRELATMQSSGMGKQYAQKGGGQTYWDELTQVLQQHDEHGVLLVGPGHTRERYLDHLKDRHDDIAKRCRTEAVYQTGLTGVHEAIKRGAVSRAAEGVRQAEDLEAVHEIQDALAKGLATYGPEHVEKAITLGNAELIVVLDNLVEDLREVLEAAEDQQGTVRVIAEETPAGEIVDAMAGVICKKRWKDHTS